jgi:RND family efflux transporter MFP subunit
MRQFTTAARVLIGLLSGFILLHGCAKKGATPPAAPPEVLVTPVLQRDIPVIKEWVGTLDGSVNVTIQSRVTGYLISQNYKEGAFVRQGDLLFKIDARPFEVALAQAKAALAKARATQARTALDETRYVEAYAKRAVSQQDRDNAITANTAAKADVVAQQAAVSQAELNLGYTRITAPVSGIAGSATAQLGDLVNAGSSNLTTLSAVDPIKVYFWLSEQEYIEAAPRIREVEAIAPARREPLIELILSNGDLYSHRGRFDFADRQVDPRTGTIRIAALFPNPGNYLRPGQFARVRAPVRTIKGALLVPQRAVNELQGTYQVVVVGPDNKAHIRPVEVGERVGSWWAIASGLQPRERVVAEGIQKAREGMAVVARPWTAPPLPAATPPPTPLPPAAPAQAIPPAPPSQPPARTGAR